MIAHEAPAIAGDIKPRLIPQDERVTEDVNLPCLNPKTLVAYYSRLRIQAKMLNETPITINTHAAPERESPFEEPGSRILDAST